MKRTLLVLIAIAACGEGSRGQPDAPPSIAPKKAHEVVSGGGRITSATYTLDVQIGHGVQQSKATSTTYTLEGNAAVKP